MAHIVLINPRFNPSYWGMNYALPFLGAQAVLPVINLPLLAALTPPGHEITIIDENVQRIDFDLCARADIVGITGMNVQRLRMHAILDELTGPRRVHRHRRSLGYCLSQRLRRPARRHLYW